MNENVEEKLEEALKEQQRELELERKEYERNLEKDLDELVSKSDFEDKYDEQDHVPHEDVEQQAVETVEQKLSP